MFLKGDLFVSRATAATAAVPRFFICPCVMGTVALCGTSYALYTPFFRTDDVSHSPTHDKTNNYYCNNITFHNNSLSSLCLKGFLRLKLLVPSYNKYNQYCRKYTDNRPAKHRHPPFSKACICKQAAKEINQECY